MIHGRPVPARPRALDCDRAARAAARDLHRVPLVRPRRHHARAPAPGLLVGIGCMGRGIALQTAMGQAMAEYVATGDEGALPLPLTPVRPLPFYGLHNAVAAAFIAWYRFLDRHGMA